MVSEGDASNHGVAEVTGPALLLSNCHQIPGLLSRGCIEGSHPPPDLVE
jgi:hypothetical protein